MKKNLVVAAILAVVFLSQTAFAQVACDVGAYSKYVNGIGGVADDHTVIQGECTKTFTNGAYVNGWFSESVRDPGLSKTYGNEIDLTLGWADKISEKWSADAHAAYFDITNPRLLDGMSGDLLNAGGTLKYHATSLTSVYANLEGYHGIGAHGLPGGWRGGIGVQTQVGPANVNGTLFHNHNFLGHGPFLKLSVEPVAPVWKIGSGQVRPNVTLSQPFGEYKKAHKTQVAVAVRIDW